MAKRRHRDVTAEELVTDLHPYHEWTAGHTGAAAAQMAELLRYLNHATQHPEALPNPDVLGSLLQVLGQTVRRLPQVLKQSAARLDALAGDPGLVLTGSADPAGDPAARARELGRELFDADAGAGSGLGDRLDAIGREVERLSFEIRRLALRRDPSQAPAGQWEP